MDFLRKNFLETSELLSNFLLDNQNYVKLQDVIKLVSERHIAGGKGLICGNGGSACEAMHYAEELTGRFRKDRKALGAISLLDPSHITCVGNDWGFDYIFERGVEALGSPRDYLLVFSTSGNSENILKAVQKANELNILTIGLLGRDGGKVKDLLDYSFIVPAQTSDRIQEVHMVLVHTIIEGIERLLFKENYD